MVKSIYCWNWLVLVWKWGFECHATGHTPPTNNLWNFWMCCSARKGLENPTSLTPFTWDNHCKKGMLSMFIQFVGKLSANPPQSCPACAPSLMVSDSEKANEADHDWIFCLEFVSSSLTHIPNLIFYKTSFELCWNIREDFYERDFFINIFG